MDSKLLSQLWKLAIQRAAKSDVLEGAFEMKFDHTQGCRDVHLAIDSFSQADSYFKKLVRAVNLC
jgi:hypothetical protein